jgi:FkbM family methyltransferase
MVFTLLQKNLGENRCENVKAYFNAVYDQNEVELFFPVPDLKKFPCYGSYGIEPNAKAGKVVKSLTIESLQFTSHINFMKVDVQGSDLAAMKGAVETIRAHQMPIIFEYEEQFQNEFGTSFQDYVEFVDGIGYSFIETVDNINYLITPKQTGRQSRPAHSG